jgi:hypothetical protein
MAVRSAVALELNTEDDRRAPFAKEERRRLWYALCVLDLSVAVDFASEALMLPGTFDTPRPTNVNDTDIFPDMKHAPVARTGWTDMTFSLMMCEITLAAKKAHDLHAETWQERREVIFGLQQELQSKYFAHCQSNVLLHQFALAIGKNISGAVLLHSMRPTRASPCTANSRADAEYMLPVAMEALTQSQLAISEPAFAGWNWTQWTQWHTIAVGYATATVLPDNEATRLALPVLNSAYQYYKGLNPHGHRARLCGPLEKLSRRANAVHPPPRQGLADAGAALFNEGQATVGVTHPDLDAEFNIDGDMVQDWSAWDKFLDEFAGPMNMDFALS